MENWIKNVRIQNFKSLRDASLACERINIFVGKPNVGKSNLLEALSLFGISYERVMKTALRDFVRYEQTSNLFYDQDYFDESVLIECNGVGSVFLIYANGKFNFTLETPTKGRYTITLSPEGGSAGGEATPPAISNVKYYRFPETQIFNPENQEPALSMPRGENLLYILRTNKAFRKEASSLFEQYGLELLLDPQVNRLELIKRKDGILIKTPFSLVADTLRRYLFHLAAIESNRGSIILFEEPEAHNYPPFITRLANRILSSKTNQFFVTTHSPFLLNTLVESGIKEVAVFLVSFENYETKVNRLSTDELASMLDYGLDIFMNQEAFV
ncbi:MAG: AAA family ATPase [Saprospiraceae bacterium]|nr:AAA family ATPase [Saprospiraceae bacterium]